MLQKRLEGFWLDVEFTAYNGLVVLFGPSGSGKSLTLQAIAGIVAPDSGMIRLDEQVLYDSASRRSLSPQQRHVGYVPQHYALFPHLTVAHNIAFGLRALSRGKRQHRVAELLDLFHLHELARRHPHQLSGGQQQRVALARALAVQPRILLLDEPFAALDATLRSALRQELLQVQERWGITMLVVSHDLADVFALGQQVIVYDGGKVIQQGGRHDIFFRPANHRVAEFVQTGNILPAVVEHADATILWLRWQGYRLAAPPQPLTPGTPVYLCIRPTQLLIVRDDRFEARRRDNLLAVTVVREEMQAEMYTLYLRLDHSDTPADLYLELPGYVYHRLELQTVKRLTIELPRAALHVIPRAAAPPSRL